MAAQGSRTLKLSLLADVAEFSKNIKGASKDTETIGDQFTAFGKKAAAAFAVAGAAIGAFAIDSIKNAAADEKAQRLLALTIENTTTATAEQIKGVEKYITTTSIAIGVTDDELRPAFARLTRSTNNVEEAQKLLNLALDISSATGKPLEAVATALGKAYDGNLTSLGRLGLGIDQSVLKSKDFDLVFQSLTSTFGGFAENEAQSTEKSFARIKIAVDEAQEQIGAALLPIVQELTAFIISDVLPVFQSFVDGLTGQDGLTGSLTESQEQAVKWGKKVRGIIDTVIDLKDQLIVVGAIIAGVFVTAKIAAAVQGTIILIKSLIAAYNLLKASALVAGIAQAFALNPLLGVGAVALAAAVLAAANALVGNDEKLPEFAVGGAPGAIKGGIGAGGGFGGAGGGAGGGGGGKATTNGGGGVSAVVSNAAIVTKKAEQIVTDIAGAFDNFTSGTTTLAGINAASNRPFAFGTSGVNTSSLAGIMAASAQPTITINVNAPSIIDEEAFSRATTNALNNSSFRGTNGANNLVFL